MEGRSRLIWVGRTDTDVASGQQIGSNYDPTGNNTQGRVTVVFRGNWAQVTDVARTNMQGLELVEVA